MSLATKGSERALSPVLPEVHRCLDAGHSCLRRGDVAGAQAQADLVLIGEPIIVAVKFESDLGARERKDGDVAVEAALNAWADALDDEVVFRRDDDASAPTVTIRHQQDVVRNGENLGGWIGWTRTPASEGEGGGYEAEILIRTRRTDGRRMSVETLTHAATHELGHVLGLADVPDRGPLMGQIDPNQPAPGIGAADIRAVRDLRRRAYDLLRAASRRATGAVSRS